MPTDEKNIELLKELIKKVFNRPLETDSDYKILSKDIYEKTKFQLSSQTLKRFFGKIQSEFSRSKNTIHVLCVYCGFENYEDFTNSLLNIELNEFYNTENLNEKKLWKSSNALCKKILQKPEELLRTHHKLMNLPRVRRYFMEEHPMRDLLGTVYSQYFIEYLKYATTSDARIFGYSFLYSGAFLTENLEMMGLYSDKLQKLKVDPHTFVLPVAHRYGALLQQAASTSKNFDSLFHTMLQDRENYIEASEHCVCSFEFTVLEHLIFTNRTQEMLKLVELQTHQKHKNSYFVPDERINTHKKSWELLCVWAFWQNGLLNEAKELLSTIKPADFCVGWNYFYGALFRILHLHLTDDEAIKIKLKEELEEIIHFTNFTYLKRYLNPID